MKITKMLLQESKKELYEIRHFTTELHDFGIWENIHSFETEGELIDFLKNNLGMLYNNNYLFRYWNSVGDSFRLKVEM